MLSAALFAAIMILGIALIAYQVLMARQVTVDKPIKDVTDAITASFRQAVGIALANLTNVYNRTGDLASARQAALQFLSRWKLAAMAAYADVGLQIDFSITSQPTIKLQSSKAITCQFSDDLGLTQGQGSNKYELVISKSFIGPEPDRYAYNLTKLYWYYPESISSALTTLRLNLTALGFYGWTQDVLVQVNASIHQVTSFDPKSFPSPNKDYPYGSTNINLTVTQEYGIPVSTLDNNSVRVSYLDNKTNTWVRATLKSITYLGGGNYNLTLSPHIPDPYIRYLHIWVNDSRKIMVELCSLPYYDMTIQDNAPASRLIGSDETFVFELTETGRISWLGKDMNRSGSGPFPFPPIPDKQFALNATTTGLSSSFVERPIQLEVWNNGFTIPRSVYNPNRVETMGCRFNQSDKLVFEVNYPPYPPNSNQQKVRIWWHDDADWHSAASNVYFKVSNNDVVLSNGLVNITTYLITDASQYLGYDLRVDYKGMSSYVGLQGWEYSSATGWQPARVPAITWNGTNPAITLKDARGDMLSGPVRAFIFTSISSYIDRTQNPVRLMQGPLNLNALIYVASGTRYAVMLVNGTWQTTTTGFYTAQYIYSKSQTSFMIPGSWSVPPRNYPFIGTFSTTWQYKQWVASTANLSWTEWNSTGPSVPSVGFSMFGGQGFKSFFNTTTTTGGTNTTDCFVAGSDGTNMVIEPRLINEIPKNLGGMNGNPLTIKSGFFSYGSAVWAYDGNNNDAIQDHFMMFQGVEPGRNYWPTVVSEG